MNQQTVWLTHNTWTCKRHLFSGNYPVNRATCHIGSCKEYCVGRPSMKSRPAPPEETTLCAWIDCKNGVGDTRAEKRNNSKYCSRSCSNKNARRRFKVRNLEHKIVGEPNGTNSSAGM